MMLVPGGGHQRRATLDVYGIRICSALEKTFHNRRVPEPSSNDQRSTAEAISDINIAAMGKQGLHPH